jgi:hypothetical protein
MDWDFPIRTLIPTVQRLDYTLVKHHVSDYCWYPLGKAGYVLSSSS